MKKYKRPMKAKNNGISKKFILQTYKERLSGEYYRYVYVNNINLNWYGEEFRGELPPDDAREVFSVVMNNYGMKIIKDLETQLKTTLKEEDYIKVHMSFINDIFENYEERNKNQLKGKDYREEVKDKKEQYKNKGLLMDEDEERKKVFELMKTVSAEMLEEKLSNDLIDIAFKENSLFTVFEENKKNLKSFLNTLEREDTEDILNNLETYFNDREIMINIVIDNTIKTTKKRAKKNNNDVITQFEEDVKYINATVQSFKLTHEEKVNVTSTVLSELAELEDGE